MREGSLGCTFVGLSSRLLKTAHAFSWLLPNLKRLRDHSRQLHAGILKSMGLHGAPLWEDNLSRRERGPPPQAAMGHSPVSTAH